MEELRKLEQVQRVLAFMQSRNFVSSSALDSNRFLANLILLLVQPCGELHMDEKCSLIAQYLPKISVAFLQEASQWLGLDGVVHAELKHNGNLHDTVEGNLPLKRDYGLSQVQNNDDVAMVGLEAMERANSTLEDFCRSYFMFHGMDVNKPQSIFKYLPLLSFTESYIYQLDRLNENILHLPIDGVAAPETGFQEVADPGCIVKSRNVFETDPFKPILRMLECRELLTERIREELRHGEEYWALERNLCHALESKREISVEDVMRAIHMKSFDYRVLNLLLYQLRGEQVNDLHMEFLSVSEFLVELSDDLFDYEDDVLENNFNILRMFIKIYGPPIAPAMLAKYITETEEKYDKLLKTLDPHLSLNYQRRCAEATKEGGKISGHPLGTWSIPPLILDENLYRTNCLNT